jgi:holo-[acyl-carrier protein] synthase
MSSLVGLGLDLVDLERFAGILDRHGDAFLRRVYTHDELARASGRRRATHLGGLFAAKEAAMKALGTGWGSGVTFQQVEVVRAPSGAPALHWHGEAARRVAALAVTRAHLTITHDARVAAAVVALEGELPGRAPR